MNRVVEVATKLLNHDAYTPRNTSRRSKFLKDRKAKRHVAESDDESSDNESSSSSSSSSSSEEDSSSSDEDEPYTRTRLRGRKKRMVREDVLEDAKNDEISDSNVQTNIDDLAERFKQLELKLGEHGNADPQMRNTRSSVLCFMCGEPGHIARECPESKFFLGQGICRIDSNNRVVMNDGSALPRAEGEGGASKVIRERMVSSGPTPTSALNVEVVSYESYYNDESEELAALGGMEFEVLLPMTFPCESRLHLITHMLNYHHGRY